MLKRILFYRKIHKNKREKNTWLWLETAFVINTGTLLNYTGNDQTSIKKKKSRK
uniref:Uncharacterized protein n=1 Tax=Anguilla anguilla TaxID=7936 RepID=A0A0E9QFN2_ANGAN